MGCNQSAAKPAAKPEVVTSEETKPAEKPAPLPPAAEPAPGGGAGETNVKVGQTVFVSQDGGFEAEVLRCTTTDVLVKGPGDKERWCEMEDIQVRSTAAGPPLQAEVQVGQRVTTARGVVGTVTKRTTTEVCVKTEADQEVWVDVEDISFLRVCIQGAAGLRDAEIVTKSDPYCICQLEGKPQTKVQTTVVQDNLDPQWNFEVKMVAYERGDVLTFDVYDKDLKIKSDDLLGRARLTSEQLEGNGFFGDLQLEGGCACKGCLRIQVRLENTEVLPAQPEAEPPVRQPNEPTVEETKASPPKGACCW